MTGPTRGRLFIALVLGLIALAAAVALWPLDREPDPNAVAQAYQPGMAHGIMEITYPLDGAVFPPEIVPPTFRWSDATSGADRWVVSVACSGRGGLLNVLVREPHWTPSDDQWATIKRGSVEREALVTVLGVGRRSPRRVLSAGRVAIRTAADPVGAPIFYREVNLPFEEAVRDPSRIRWRLGDISRPDRPPIVLENLPVCGNCHSFSMDGRVLGMDVDYANDKGSYAICQVESEITLDKSKIITWSDFARADGQPTFGLLSQVSPDGRYVVSTVKDRSVFVPRPDLAFSQLFFPVMGILAVYDRVSHTFASLPGADDRALVQSNPAWSPDGRQIVFTRARAHVLPVVGDKVLLTPEECREFLAEGKTFLFDLYRLPFNEGRGGTPEPVAGASHNGRSNYFPKFSPDGRWIVFCQARSFSLLQPDSQLYIIPAEGGRAQRLRANTARMNSWHSWSPNGRWLVFSSKANGPYTQLWLTHIDAQGESAPPVLLEHFTAPDRAANIPEFVNLPPGTPLRIREAFIDDLSYRRAGEEALLSRDWANAERLFRQALALNPRNGHVHNHLALALLEQDRVDEAFTHLELAIRWQPDIAQAHLNRGAILVRRGRGKEAIPCFREAIRLDPAYARAHVLLARNLLALGHGDEAIASYQKAVDLEPNNVTWLVELAEALIDDDRLDEAFQMGTRALTLARARGETRRVAEIQSLLAACRPARRRSTTTPASGTRKMESQSPTGERQP